MRYGDSIIELCRPAGALFVSGRRSHRSQHRARKLARVLSRWANVLTRLPALSMEASTLSGTPREHGI